MSKASTIARKHNWRVVWETSIARFQLIGGSVYLFTLLAAMPFFFASIELRKGVQLNDWVLNHIGPYDVSVPIFTFIWGMGALAFYRAWQKPSMYVTYVWVYATTLLIRGITISLVKLDPPAGLIPLTDPLTGIFYGHTNVTKDLFFSGHTATLCLIWLTLERKWDKTIAFISMIVVMYLLLVQHVHYTMDVIVAPFATYAIFKIVTMLLGNDKASALK